MTLLDTARQALVELPISDIVRERLSLALDRLEEAESKMTILQTENGKLQSQLENVTLDRDKAREQHQRLQDEHREDIRIFRSLEFRRGLRTNKEWLPFCPQCHMPVAIADRERNAICTGSCGWTSGLTQAEFREVLKQFDENAN